MKTTGKPVQSPDAGARTSPSLAGSRLASRTVTAVTLALLAAGLSGSWWNHLLEGTAWQTWRAPLSNTGDVILMVLLLRLATGKTLIELVRTSGLLTAPAASLRWALAWALPVLGIALLWLPFASPEPSHLFWNALVYPFAEEWLYRGLAIGALMRWAGWRWWTAALLPAFAFGVAHLGQGRELTDSLGIFAVTAAGGLLFGWLFYRWGGNLWPAIWLHAGLNAFFLLFDLGHNALLGWEGNVLRTVTVVWALVLVRWMGPPTQPRSDAEGQRTTPAT